MSEIINRVAQSQLITIDLEDYYTPGPRYQIDIAQWLYEGLIVKEKEFRASLQQHPWETYQNGLVALHCSTDAIVPSWAYMLVSIYLNPFAKKVIIGHLAQLEIVLYTEKIQQLDVQAFENKPLIVKGCSHKPVPETAYVLLIERLFPIAKSIMYGEACSAVPLYKRKK